MASKSHAITQCTGMQHRCTGCNDMKSVEMFYKNKETPRGNFTMAVFTSVFEFVNTLEEPLDADRLIRGLKFVGADELNNKSRGKNRTVNGRKAVQDAYEAC